MVEGHSKPRARFISSSRELRVDGVPGRVMLHHLSLNLRLHLHAEYLRARLGKHDTDNPLSGYSRFIIRTRESVGLLGTPRSTLWLRPGNAKPTLTPDVFGFLSQVTIHEAYPMVRGSSLGFRYVQPCR